MKMGGERLRLKIEEPTQKSCLATELRQCSGSSPLPVVWAGPRKPSSKSPSIKNPSSLGYGVTVLVCTELLIQAGVEDNTSTFNFLRRLSAAPFRGPFAGAGPTHQVPAFPAPQQICSCRGAAPGPVSKRIETRDRGRLVPARAQSPTVACRYTASRLTRTYGGGRKQGNW
jgi:hypothetical protein